MTKLYLSIAVCFVFIGGAIWVWRENNQAKLQMLQHSLDAQKDLAEQNNKQVLSRLKASDEQNQTLRVELENLLKQQEAKEKEMAEAAKVEPEPVIKIELQPKPLPSKPVVLVDDKDKKIKELEKTIESLKQELKIESLKLANTEKDKNEVVDKLKEVMRQPMQVEDPFDLTLPTHSTIHDLVGQGMKEWLELGEFLKLSLNEKDARGNTPVHLAAKLGLNDQLDVLYKFGNKIDDKDDFGKTPLHHAVEAKSDSMAWFLGKGVDYNVKDKNGWKLIHYAAKVGNMQAGIFLKSRAFDIHEAAPKGITPLMVAIAYKQPKMVLWFLKQGANIHARDELGQTPLHYAARFADSDMLRYLRNFGPGINTPDVHGRTALHYAAILGKEKVAQSLLSMGAIAVVKDNGHCSAIHHAAMGNHDDLVVRLLEHGVHVDELDVVGRTPLHIAVVLGNTKLVGTLIEWGANITMVDGIGRSPIEWAERLKRHHIIKLFEDL